MSQLFGEYVNDYEEIHFSESIHDKHIYKAFNTKENRDVSLKLLKKEEYKGKDSLFEKMKKEFNILTLCKSENILNGYRYFETENNVVLEQEYYETNLREYLMDNGPCDYNQEFFKEIFVGVVKALKTLHEKGIIHRNIRTSHIFLAPNESSRGENLIKLGEFGTAIYAKENKSEPLNSIFYTAPEIVNGEEYNEKCDLWSFAIALYEIYFGQMPFGSKPVRSSVIRAISEEGNFQIKKTNLPSLDLLFEGLLKINPKQRLSHEQLFKLVFDYNFMEENENEEFNRIYEQYMNDNKSADIKLNVNNDNINIENNYSKFKEETQNKKIEESSNKIIILAYIIFIVIIYFICRFIY